jgi:hypothetical protein
MRAALERPDVEVVAYNDPFIDPVVSRCAEGYILFTRFIVILFLLSAVISLYIQQ